MATVRVCKGNPNRPNRTEFLRILQAPAHETGIVAQNVFRRVSRVCFHAFDSFLTQRFLSMSSGRGHGPHLPDLAYVHLLPGDIARKLWNRATGSLCESGEYVKNKVPDWGPSYIHGIASSHLCGCSPGLWEEEEVNYGSLCRMRSSGIG